MILECCESQVVFLLPSEIKVLNGPYIQQLLEATLLPPFLPVIKILGHSKLDSGKLWKIILLVFQQGILPLKGPTAAKFL